MPDLTIYMATWYLALFYLALLVFGGAFVSYLIFGGEYSSYLVGSSMTAIVVSFVSYRQKSCTRGF